MKKLLILLMLLSSIALKANEPTIDLVYDETISIDSAYSKEFRLSDKVIGGFRMYSDTLSFQLEVASATGLTTSNAGDSLDITFKLLPISYNGLQDTTTYANWLTVLTKGEDQGRVAYGSQVPLLPSQKHAGKGYITILNKKYPTKQTVRIRIYAIKQNRR